MIVVTGGAGFIGSNIVRSLNELGRDDVLVVDDLRDGHKIVNLADCDIVDYVDRDAFLERVVWGEELGRIDAVLHQGACSDTTEWDGTYVMRVNYEYSKALLHWCAERSVPFIYASSASGDGAGPEFVERREHERPLNMYAYSKFQFDQYVRRRLPDLQTQVAGLRYFNVYGPREQHKGRMASVAWRFDRQIVEGGRARLFCGSDGYGDGEQRRDFVWVGDVVAVNLWLLEHPGVSGLFNVGSGRAQTFNDVARAVIDFHGRGEIEYIPFPVDLEGRYQSFTEADISALRRAGFERPFADVATGVRAYLEWLHR